MKQKLLLIGSLLLLMSGCATTTPPSEAESYKHGQAKLTAPDQPKLYNEALNPRQIEHPDHLGFNDLHIQAIRHLVPDTHSVHDPKLQVIVHHHCKAYDDGTFVCMMFPTGMKDQDKPIGFEYIITTEQFNTLPEAEKKYWHYHKVEVAKAHATFPDLTQEEAAKILPAVHETYGKVIYFQKPDDKYPLGEPYIVIVQHMPEQD
ncbi:DUF1264 domain-containing protein [Methylicorpusculum sp.]|uniref:DUF1264 domain-containing protein n=1 Tax=Methylicorpusculum sp. TaxID=2713644 RepID=UPI002731D3F0|nr:DUF1264 domain-containing protein [Methylicorpusculum sp.]MDP2180416.1 DUF1264 domain-containing protein [Methylicorpusculum sp.]MDP3530815.1 DUF1264 domain-containing protein [Methylicorpusculum sp.]MDZ4151251.1 DUF1264 domain-containing protein [Methylicorpusculum sp.]